MDRRDSGINLLNSLSARKSILFYTICCRSCPASLQHFTFLKTNCLKFSIWENRWHTFNIGTTFYKQQLELPSETLNLHIIIVVQLSNGSEVCSSYLDSGKAGLWRGVSGSGPNLSYTRCGWWQVFWTPLYGRSEVLGTSGRIRCMQRWQRHRNRWMDRQNKWDWRQKEQWTGTIRLEEVQGLVGKGKIKRRPAKERVMQLILQLK